MRRLLLLGVLLLAACSSGAEAGDDELPPECAEGGLLCLLLDEADLAEVFGDDVTIEGQPATQLGATVSWCDRPLPTPVERIDRAFTASSTTNGVTVAVTSTGLRYDGADAEVTVTALRELRQGCSWQEGDATFRFLDHIDVADFGDEAIGLLMRVELDGVSDNTELVFVRHGTFLAQAGFFPAQDSPVLWDAVARRLDERLIALLS
ncbi:MAG: hypothetical protein AAGD18_07495 [Actinomycetota bacterium]